MSEPRRFLSPWSVDEADSKLDRRSFTVRDKNGQALAHVYFEEEPGRRSAAKLLTRDHQKLPAAFSGPAQAIVERTGDAARG
jgi:putative heme degradation protein